MVARIWAKLSDFVHEYSRNIFCEFYSSLITGMVQQMQQFKL